MVLSGASIGSAKKPAVPLWELWITIITLLQHFGSERGGEGRNVEGNIFLSKYGSHSLSECAKFNV